MRKPIFILWALLCPNNHNHAGGRMFKLPEAANVEGEENDNQPDGAADKEDHSEDRHKSLGFIWPIFLPNSYLSYCRDYLCIKTKPNPADEAVYAYKKIVVTAPNIPGKKIVRVLGLVRGNTIRARHVGKDIVAGLRMWVAKSEYAKLLSESREQALDRMLVEAESLGANAVIACSLRPFYGWCGRNDGLRNRGYSGRKLSLNHKIKLRFTHFD